MGLLHRIQKVLRILPPSLSRLVSGNIELRKEERFIGGKKVDASYDLETERILFWGNLKLDDFDLVIVLMHEIGHFLFHRLLRESDRKRWLTIYAEENLDFGLRKDYPTVQIPEEAF